MYVLEMNDKNVKLFSNLISRSCTETAGGWRWWLVGICADWLHM